MIEIDDLYPQRVTALARTQPDAEFLRDVDGRHLTYLETDRAALRWAAFLDGVVGGADRTVATMLPTGIDYVTVMLGFGRSRATEVPVNTALRGRTLQHVLTDSSAVALILAERYLDLLETVPADSLPEQVIVLPETDHPTPSSSPNVRWLRELPEPAAGFVPAEPRPQDIAWILYTSGTTGPAKGVLCTWAQTALTAIGVFPLAELTSADVYYTALPMFHVAGRIGPYLAALLGSRCVIRESFDTERFWPDIREHGCTTTQLFPATMHFLHDRPPLPDDARNPLRNVLLAPVTAQFEEFSERFDLRICTTWNMTETSAPLVSRGFALSGPASCGQLRDGFAARIADDEGRPVPPGEVGELLVRSEIPHALMAGYLNRPEATVEAWKDLWFHTGDAFRMDPEGNYYYVDRRKDALRRRGENISSLDVELDVLTHPDVQQAAVIGVPSKKGEDEVMLCAVLREGSTLGEQELSDFLEPLMPRFMLPEYIEFFEELPQTPTFRVQKHQLRARGVRPTTWRKPRRR